MQNMFTVVGRLAEKELLDEKDTLKIVVAVARTFKEEDGIYETDLIPVTLKGNIAKNSYEYCNKGDVVGIKGTIKSLDGKSLSLEADKVSFLASAKNEEK